MSKSASDPGFPKRGGANPKGVGEGGANYYFAKFSQKLHENEEN